MIDHVHEPGTTRISCRQCNPYPQYVLTPTLGTGPQEISAVLQTLPTNGTGPHSHAEADVTALVTDLAGKAPTHTHPYAATSHAHLDADIPAAMARDAEVTSAIATHAATPHGGASEAFPVGSVFIGIVSTNPATLLGYGTWAAFGAGKVLIGRDTGQSGKDLLGAATHSHGAHTDHAALTHGGATVGNHTFTQPAAHSNHTVTQPADHANNIAHTHGLNVQGGTTAAVTGTHVMTSTATGGSARAITAGDAGLSSGSGAALAHSATAVDAHSAHSGGAVDAHTVGQANQHAAQSHSAHDSVAHLPPSIVVYLWERTA